MLTLVSIHFLLLGFFNPTDLPYAEIENSFEINDSDLIISNCEEMVLMDIEDDEGIYNHSQARMVLNDFFTVKVVDFLHFLNF